MIRSFINQSKIITAAAVWNAMMFITIVFAAAAAVVVLVVVVPSVTADVTTTTTTLLSQQQQQLPPVQHIEPMISTIPTTTSSCVTIDEMGNTIVSSNENCVDDARDVMEIQNSIPPSPGMITPQNNVMIDATAAVDGDEEHDADEEQFDHDDEEEYDHDFGNEEDEHEYTENDDHDEESEGHDFEDQEENIPLGSDIGIIQSLDATYEQEIYDQIKVQQKYVREQVQVNDQYVKVRKLCRNTHESCTYWAILGECDANPGYMKIHCGPACQTCEQLHVETRCPMNDLEPSVFDQKDDLNKFYERIINDPYYQSQYNVTVLSRPKSVNGANSNDNTNEFGLWVVQFDNMLSEEEAKHMIDLGYKEGYERSADVGEEKEDGTFGSSVNEGRTSTNAWCMSDCMNDTVTERVHERMENITMIPRINYENLQILQYTEQQYYNEHNDFIEYQVDRPCGSRILTFYFYLNTLPEDIGGGGTNFPKLNLTVTPKLGRAILWPSILNDNPYAIDLMSNHQALPVLNGHVKYGFNAWIHQRDFQTNNNIGCA